jgi:hypothetical protein
VADDTAKTKSAAESDVELIALLTGDPALGARLEGGERLRAVTPFRYPGRGGPVAVHVARVQPGAGVRISDGGGLLRSLEEQGMDLAIDMILSKTVFHAVRQVDGAGISGGQVFLDSEVTKLSVDVWRFLQVVLEIIGLRHSKYKDALIRLSRRQEGPDLVGWTE